MRALRSGSDEVVAARAGRKVSPSCARYIDDEVTMQERRLSVMRALSGVIAMIASTLLPLGLGLGFAGSAADAAAIAFCTTSQLGVRFVAPHTDETKLYAPNTTFVNIKFTNGGLTCVIQGDAPIVQPMLGARPVGTGSSGAFVATTYVLLCHGQSSLSPLAVLARVPEGQKRCAPMTTNGLSISRCTPVSTGTQCYTESALRGRLTTS